MKKQWILYICIFLLLCGVAARGNASISDAETMASAFAADYRTVSETVAAYDMACGDIIIEARLPIGTMGEETLRSIRDKLPPDADFAVVSDRCHDTRWLHITCPAGTKSVQETARDILTAVAPVSLDRVQLALNVRWETSVVYSTTEKETLIDSLFTSFEAHAAASMADERMVSASGYSPVLSSCAGDGAEAMNITASLCTDPDRQGSTLWIGTPVLTVEY